MKKYIRLLLPVALVSVVCSADPARKPVLPPDLGSVLPPSLSAVPTGGGSWYSVAPNTIPPWEGVEFADLEAWRPLSKYVDARKQLMPDDLKRTEWTQEALDQLYARLESGPIPSGPRNNDPNNPGGHAFKRSVFIKPGSGMQTFIDLNKAGVSNNFPYKGLLTAFNIMGGSVDGDSIQSFAENMWFGKVFYDADPSGKEPLKLRNMMNVTRLNMMNFFTTGVSAESAPGKRTFLWHDSSGAQQSANVAEFFPAKLYCGQSLFDSRKESVIIDYAYSDDFDADYRGVDDKNKAFNSLADRTGLGVRDEIRMIRPGFYLGKAYSNGMFLLTFALYDEETDTRYKKGGGMLASQANDCWTAPKPLPVADNFSLAWPSAGSRTPASVRKSRHRR